LIDIPNYREPPASYDPVNFNTADGFMLGASLNSAEPDRDTSWITGRQLGFKIRIDESLLTPALALDLHFPEWITAQSFTLQINGQEIPGAWRADRSEAFWQTFVIALDKKLLKPGPNFLAIRFEKTCPAPGKENWQASALLRSVRISDMGQTTEPGLQHQ